MSEQRYRNQGEYARSNGQPRESCRYKSDHTRTPWLAGWDARDKKIAHDIQQAKVPRWDRVYIKRGQHDHTTRGDVPRIYVDQRDGTWFAQHGGLRIRDLDLGTSDSDAAKRRSVIAVRSALRKELERLDAAFDENGDLKS